MRTKDPSDSFPQGDFFGIFVETTFQVANVSLPARYDPGQKMIDQMVHGKKLFSPIYSIKTTDFFGRSTRH